MKKEVAINQLGTPAAKHALQPLPAAEQRRRLPRLQTRIGTAQSAERARMHIKALALVRLLHNVADGKKQVEPHQVTAAVALLRKVMPDLQATLIGGDPALPITIVTRME
jgi:hypothetical protein